MADDLPLFSQADETTAADKYVGSSGKEDQNAFVDPGGRHEGHPRRQEQQCGRDEDALEGSFRSTLQTSLATLCLSWRLSKAPSAW